MPRNRTDASEFGVSRFGIGTSFNLPAKLIVQAAGGLTTGADQLAFFLFGISRSLTHQ